MLNDPKQAVLVIFCRRPAFGTGKQRIAAEIGKAAALQVANLLLDATLEDARKWPGKVVLAPARPADTQWARDLLPDADIVPQPAGNLGQRINHVDTIVRARGARCVIFIGTDAPGMTPACLQDAASALEKSSAVFIPATDGGVTLLGADKSWPKLDDLAWETDRLYPELKNRCESVGWKCTELATGFDVDTRADLILTANRLIDDKRATRQTLRRWINSASLEHFEQPQTPLPRGSISVVIPVYRDADALANLLARLDELTPTIDEVLVIDSSADAICEDLCNRPDIRYFRGEPSRGAQLHFGATLARGDIIWFLHADSEPARESAQLIRAHIADGNIGGYFKFNFTGTRRWYKSLLEIGINLRATLGIPYGDQGLFARQDCYCNAGGFPPAPLFEEVRLVQQLRLQGCFAALPLAIGVATRRWDRDGWLRRSMINRMLALKFMLGVPPERLARSYRSKFHSDGTD